MFSLACLGPRAGANGRHRSANLRRPVTPSAPIFTTRVVASTGSSSLARGLAQDVRLAGSRRVNLVPMALRKPGCMDSTWRRRRRLLVPPILCSARNCLTAQGKPDALRTAIDHRVTDSVCADGGHRSVHWHFWQPLGRAVQALEDDVVITRRLPRDDGDPRRIAAGELSADAMTRPRPVFSTRGTVLDIASVREPRLPPSHALVMAARPGRERALSLAGDAFPSWLHPIDLGVQCDAVFFIAFVLLVVILVGTHSGAFDGRTFRNSVTPWFRVLPSPSARNASNCSHVSRLSLITISPILGCLIPPGGAAAGEQPVFSYPRSQCRLTTATLGCRVPRLTPSRPWRGRHVTPPVAACAPCCPAAT